MKWSDFPRISGKCLWQTPALSDLFPTVLRAALEAIVDELLRDGVPIAPSLMPFRTEDGCVRPRGHLRAYYVPLHAADESLLGYLAVKGSEPMQLAGIEPLFTHGLAEAWLPELTMASLDVLPIHEHKVPMILTTGEARHDAELGLRLQTAYAARYRELPHLPYPLAVLRWPEEQLRKTWERMQPFFSAFACEIATRVLSQGAAAYVYYYPVAPFPRVRHLSQQLADAGPRRLERLQEHGEPQRVIARWVQLFVRLLALGYLPAAPCQTVIGQAIQAQNSVVGGGFVDVDSIRPLADLRARDFHESYALSLLRLANTIGCYLFASVTETPGLAAADTLCLLSTYDQVSRAIAEDIRLYGDSFDPRLKALPPFSGEPTSLLRLAETLQATTEKGLYMRLTAGDPLQL